MIVGTPKEIRNHEHQVSLTPASVPTALTPQALYTRCDPDALGIASSAELAELDTALIHERALEAIQLGLDIRHDGYNIYLLGESGSGRHAIVNQRLETQRRTGQPPSDWCYVNDFTDSSKPELLRLPCGRNHGVILPMSGKKSRSSIVGTRCTGVVSDGSTASSERRARSSTLRSPLATSSWWPPGCSMLLLAPA